MKIYIIIKTFIYNICLKLHMLPFARYVCYQLRRILNLFKYHKQDDKIHKVIIKYLSLLKNLEIIKRRNIVLIVGGIVEFDKGSCNYLNLLSNNMPEYNFLLLSEAPWKTKKLTQEKINFPFFLLPYYFGFNKYVVNKKKELSKKARCNINNKEYIKLAAANIKKRYSDNSNEFSAYLMNEANYFFSKSLNIIKPRKIIIWNKFYALHSIIDTIARKKNIPVVYMEFGSLPGTFALETFGQMGESFPAREITKFLSLKTTDSELQNAERIIKYLRESKLNRNYQPESDSSKIQEKLIPGRPIVLYAGQNDYESGLYPYTSNTYKYHSPVFSSSYEAMIFLAELAGRNNWNVIYKPHPGISCCNNEPKDVPDNVLRVDQVNINDLIDIVDVVVTIFSQVSYISLIREKPVIMLGYNQLRGKNCCYEAFNENYINNVITQAINHGYTDGMKKSFYTHVAQLCKYYLYDDLQNKNVNYGKNINDAIELVKEKKR